MLTLPDKLLQGLADVRATPLLFSLQHILRESPKAHP